MLEQTVRALSQKLGLGCSRSPLRSDQEGHRKKDIQGPEIRSPEKVIHPPGIRIRRGLHPLRARATIPPTILLEGHSGPYPYQDSRPEAGPDSESPGDARGYRLIEDLAVPTADELVRISEATELPLSEVRKAFGHRHSAA